MEPVPCCQSQGAVAISLQNRRVGREPKVPMPRIRQSNVNETAKNGRDGGIRTHDPLTPSQEITAAPETR